MKTVRPSHLIDWSTINQGKADISCTAGHPENYGWYKTDGMYLPHRKPSVDEILKNKFK